MTKVMILLLSYDSKLTFTPSWTRVGYISFHLKLLVQIATFSEGQRYYFRTVALYFVNDCHR